MVTIVSGLIKLGHQDTCFYYSLSELPGYLNISVTKKK